MYQCEPFEFSSLFRARDHRGLDGDQPASDERRRTRVRAEAQAEDAGGDFLVFSRGMGEPGSPRGLSRGVVSPGEES